LVDGLLLLLILLLAVVVIAVVLVVLVLVLVLVVGWVVALPVGSGLILTSEDGAEVD